MDNYYELQECVKYGAIVYVSSGSNMIVVWDGTKTFDVYEERATERKCWYTQSFVRWFHVAIFEHECKSIHHAKQIAKDYCNKEGEYAEEVCFQGSKESQEG